MKLREFFSNKKKRKAMLRAFRMWQKRPHQVAPLSEEYQECGSCGTRYQGNYCPRCGQSAVIGRFSFKKAFLLFLDVWGVGNRGMFRTIRDLMLRPGYMIHDYLHGMQSAYFPPFKMFFLITAFSFLLDNGISWGIDERESRESAKVEISVGDNTEEDSIERQATKFTNILQNINKQNPAVFSFSFLILVSLPLYLFFMHAPRIPDLRYPEFIITLVYTSNVYSIYSIIGTLLHLNIFSMIAILMVFVSLRQFSGHSKLRILGGIIATILFAFFIVIAAACIYIFATK